MTVEQFLTLAVPVVVLLGPLVAFMFHVSARLGRIEERMTADRERIAEILDRHDRHIHDLRNRVHQLNLQLVARGVLPLEPKHEQP